MKISILLLIFICFVSCNNAEEAKRVKEVFTNYKTMLVDGELDKAVSYVDSNTIAHYSNLLDAVQNGDSLALEKLGPMEKYVVLAIRHKASHEEVLSFTPKSLISYAMNEGLEGKSRVINNDMGEVEINGRNAKAMLISNNRPTRLFWEFNQEGEEWKIDLVSLMPSAREQFHKMLDVKGVEENDFLFGLLERRSGVTPDGSIWLPRK